MKTQFIAEIAQAHDGSLGILHSYIDALADTGVQTIKFQVHMADAESSPYEKFRIPFSYVDKTRQDYWRRMEFNKSQWKEIKQHCEDKRLGFLATPFCIAAVDLLEELNVNRYKIASGSVSDLLLIDKIASTGKPVILSSGMSDLSELDLAIQNIRKKHNKISLLQCTTAYPCAPENLELLRILEFKNRYDIPVGLSDHSGSVYAGIAAVALGAEILEFHVVFDKKMFGPDSSSSLTIYEVKQLVEAVAFTEKAVRPVPDKMTTQFMELKKLFGQSLCVNKDLVKDHIIVKEDLESKKPASHGITSSEFEKVIGKKIKRNLGKYEFLNWSDLE